MKYSLTFLRESRGMSQRRLAEKANIPYRRISKFESGELRPTNDEIYRLALALLCQPSELEFKPARKPGRPKKTDDLLLPFQTERPRLARPTRCSATFLGTLRDNHPDFMERVKYDLPKWEDCLQALPGESSDEALEQVKLLHDGATFTWAALSDVGYDRWPIIDQVTGYCITHHLRPALATKDWLMFFQVYASTRRKRYRMDRLIIVHQPKLTLVNSEVDGGGHRSDYDEERAADLGLLTIRIPSAQILTGPTITDRLRKLGYCGGKR